MNKEAFLFHSEIASPIGNLLAAASEQGVLLLDFAEKDAASLRLEQLAAYTKLRLHEGENKPLKKLREELSAYFNGTLKRFTVPLELIGTEFQKTVWLSLASIPYGETISYAEQAKNLGRASSIRAVASANARNPVAILLPCHRVIGSNGKLTGYAGGLHRKKFLVDFEKKVK